MQSTNTKRRAATMIVAMLACSATALASDWYVDAVNGSNSNPGTSPSQAWRTITYAIATAPAARPGLTQMIHVAPGIYDATLGETFPILPRDAFQIVGDQGKDVTRIDAGGAASAVQAWYGHFGGNYTGPLTLMRGLTLANATVGVDMYCYTASEMLTLEDLRITGMSSTGVRSYSGCGWGCGLVTLTMSGVEISSCAKGVEFEENVISGSLVASTTLRDCTIAGNATVGIEEYNHQGGLNLTCERTRITQNGAEGLLVVHDASVFATTTQATLSDCLIDGNAGGGVRATTNSVSMTLLAEIALDLSRCTLADNAVAGLDVFRDASSYLVCHATLDSTLFWGNADDIVDNPANPSIVSAAYGDVGDGDFAGSNGNFSADPLFVDAAGGDYRLSWSSPCIESGDPSTTPGTLDLANNARPIDGELDTLERFDVGAFEFAPLFLRSTGELGTLLQLELWGPQGNATTVYFTRRPLVPAQTTPFGELDLDPAFMQIYRVTTVGSGPPKFITRPIPNDLSLIGRVFSFQALTDCAAAPNGKAYTNPVELTIVP